MCLAEIYLQFPNFKVFALFFNSICSSYLSSNFKFFTYLGLASISTAHFASRLNDYYYISYFSLIFPMLFNTNSSSYFDINLCDNAMPQNENISLTRICGKLSIVTLIFFYFSTYFWTLLFTDSLLCSFFDKPNKNFRPCFCRIA